MPKPVPCDQLRAGIDIVSDGEQTRQHFVTTFIEHLSGVDFEKREVVKFAIAMRRACRRSWVKRVRSRFSLKMPFFTSADPTTIKWACQGR